jgi:hypothetical protein
MREEVALSQWLNYVYKSIQRKSTGVYTVQPISLGETEAVICINGVKERVKLVVFNDNIQQHEIIIRRSFIFY